MSSDREFLARFERAGIPKDEWTHRAHVRLAYVLLVRLPYEAAVQCLREGIPRLNRSQGVADTATSGYHETLTVAWAALVAERVEDEALDFDTFIARHPELLRRELVLDHYSRERIFSLQARRGFLPPDRRAVGVLERAA